TLDIAANRVEIAAGYEDRCALWAADFAPRQRFQETRAGSDRRLGPCGIIGIDTSIAIDQYLGGLRESCCGNTSWDRKEKCDGTALERIHGVLFSFKQASAALAYPVAAARPSLGIALYVWASPLEPQSAAGKRRDCCFQTGGKS